METSKLVTQIAVLEKKDRERFRQFVRSPYFNQHDKTQELLDIILKSFGRKKKLEKEKVFAQIFGKQTYDEQVLYNLMSNLKKLYHRFLAYRHLEQSPYVEEMATLEDAYQNNNFDLLTNRAKQLEKKLNKSPYRDADHHYMSFRLQYLLGYYLGQHIDRTNVGRFQLMLNHLDRFYLIEKLKHCCHLTANMMLVNTHYDFSFLEVILSYIRDNKSKYDADASVVLYYTILMSLREEESTTNYQKLKKLLDEAPDSFSQPERRDLFAFASNYCIRRINQGDSRYRRELFEIYQRGVRMGMLFENGLISEWDYKNITSLGCSLGEYEWTEDFVERYQVYLATRRRENAYNYNMAYLYYHRREYESALSSLLLVQFNDVKYHLAHNFLLLRTYYALGDTEALLSLIDTFRIYVIRQRKMTTEQKQSYNRFLRFAKKMVLLKDQEGTFSRTVLEEKKVALRQKIRETDNVINSIWLLAELGEEVEEVA